MKKTLSLLLSLVMILSVVSAAAFTSSALTDINNVDFSVAKRMHLGETLENTQLAQKSGSNSFLLHPNWEIANKIYSVSGGEFSFDPPTVKDGEQYSVIFFIHPKEGYTFSKTGTYKLEGVPMTKKTLSGIDASELGNNEYAIIELEDFDYIVFRIAYKTVRFDGKFYDALLRGVDHTISGDMSKGHITNCVYSTMASGGGLSATYSEVTLPAEKLELMGAYVEVIPTYTKHSFGKLTVTKEPTEETVGIAKKTCSVCSYEQTLKIPKKEEVQMTFEVPKEGDKIPVEQAVAFSVPGYVAASAHWFDVTDENNVISATGKFTGGKKYQLAVDVAADTANGFDISTLNYLNVFIIDRFSGSEPYTSSINGRIFMIDYTLEFEHSWDDGKVTKKATCIAKGEKTFTCTGCGETKIESIPATGKHDYKILDGDEDIYAATLDSDGSITETCTGCGKDKKTVIPMVSNITISKTTFTANGKVKKPTVSVKDSKGNDVGKSHYHITYSNASSKDPGTYTVTVKAGDREDERNGWYYYFAKSFTYKIKPAKTTGLKVAAYNTTVLKLSWDKVTGAKNYQVYKSTDGKKWTKAAETTGTSVKVKDLKAGTKYQFKVRALDAKKKVAGAFSDVLKTQTKTVAPTISKLTSTKSKTATVTWKKVTGAKTYIVYKSTDGKTFKAVKTGLTGTSYTITKLTGGKTIYVKVVAVNAYSVNSAASAVKSVKVMK